MKLIIGFSKPKNKIFPIFSWLIRLFDDTKYSHVYIKWEAQGIEEQICYQASGIQVNFIGQKVFDANINIVAEYQTKNDISPILKRKLFKFCIANAGIPYGIKQIIGLALVKIFKLTKNPFQDDSQTFICSELIAIILSELFELNPTKNQDILTPKDIETTIKNSHLFSKVK